MSMKGRYIIVFDVGGHRRPDNMKNRVMFLGVLVDAVIAVALQSVPLGLMALSLAILWHGLETQPE